jgi:predicted RNA methylase
LNLSVWTETTCIAAIYRIFRRISDNADCNLDGFSGSLTAESLLRVLNAGNVFGSHFLDIGAGVGRPLSAAIALGASSVHGFELPLNQSHRYIFEASIKEISQSLYFKPIDFKIQHLDFEDIDKVL